jgi:syntaxin 5
MLNVMGDGKRERGTKVTGCRLRDVYSSVASPHDIAHHPTTRPTHGPLVRMSLLHPLKVRDDPLPSDVPTSSSKHTTTDRQQACHFSFSLTIIIITTITTMARDRTAEFWKTIESIRTQPQNLQMSQELRARRGKGTSGLSGSSGASADTSLDTYSEFMRRSRAAARDLYQTYQRLEELNRLARKTSIFDWEETSKQLNELVFLIKSDIKSLSQQIEELRKYQLSTSAKNHSRSKSHDIESHSKTVILNLQQQLATMSSDFKNTLEIRSQNNEQQRVRRERFSAPESQITRNQTSSSLIDMFDSPSSSGRQQQQQSHPQQQQSQQLLLYEDNNLQYLEERANAMQSVESTIVELGAIFNQLATMVQHQEEMITRIDANVSDTALNVEGAHQSLLQYFQTVSSNRWLMLKIFGVLFVFFIVFVIFAV